MRHCLLYKNKCFHFKSFTDDTLGNGSSSFAFLNDVNIGEFENPSMELNGQRSDNNNPAQIIILNNTGGPANLSNLDTSTLNLLTSNQRVDGGLVQAAHAVPGQGQGGVSQQETAGTQVKVQDQTVLSQPDVSGVAEGQAVPAVGKDADGSEQMGAANVPLKSEFTIMVPKLDNYLFHYSPQISMLKRCKYIDTPLSSVLMYMKVWRFDNI